MSCAILSSAAGVRHQGCRCMRYSITFCDCFAWADNGKVCHERQALLPDPTALARQSRIVSAHDAILKWQQFLATYVYWHAEGNQIRRDDSGRFLNHEKVPANLSIAKRFDFMSALQTLLDDPPPPADLHDRCGTSARHAAANEVSWPRRRGGILATILAAIPYRALPQIGRAHV